MLSRPGCIFINFKPQENFLGISVVASPENAYELTIRTSAPARTGSISPQYAAELSGL